MQNVYQECYSTSCLAAFLPRHFNLIEPIVKTAGISAGILLAALKYLLSNDVG